MKEFIEKLIGRLNERMECLDSEHKILTDSGMFRNADRIADKMTEVDLAKRIVNQLAEEYNNGWIPCSERLPKVNGWYLVTNELGVVQQQHWGGKSFGEVKG